MQARIKLSNLLVVVTLCTAMLAMPYQGVMAQELPTGIDGEVMQELVEGDYSEEGEAFEPDNLALEEPPAEATDIANESPLADQSVESTNRVYLPVIQTNNEVFDTTAVEDTSVVAAAGTSLVSRSAPIDLIPSTGNLYWTVESRFCDTWDGCSASASIIRSSKNGTPGTETFLYSEYDQSGYTYLPTFSGIIFHNFGTWYGYYFIAKYSHCATSCPTYIKRITEAGGPATIIAQIPYAASYLQTDGAYIYWADDYAVRRVPINGGTVTKLANKAGLMTMSALDAQYLYYIDAGTLIKRIPKAGGTATTLVSTTSYITDFYVHTTSTATIIFWSEETGAVRAKTVGGSTVTYQAGASARRASSVGFDGTRVLWTDCVGYSSCRVMKRQGSTTTTLVSNAGDQAGKLVWDSTQLFWGSKIGIQKYVH